ncbi:hypothetical protein ALP92_200017 [Pseudomonas syringae pv. primulae]|uniref:Uncharacterized protein n=1 Tax=Pseudomonas syringae pv. primulae TaxID=251707 RepID=A0A3M4RRL7_9PSED|nr:hypothetical protein ALP92_200017 [Pseudomonas syringae pv. primulae]
MLLAWGSNAWPLLFNTKRLPTRSKSRVSKALSNSLSAALVADCESDTAMAALVVLPCCAMAQKICN